MVTFTNPRIRAEFDDWPCGRERVKCVFRITHSARGWRVERTTTNKHGQWCKPRCHTYSGQAAIVDGSDGRTYILQVAQGFGFVSIIGSDFMCPDPAKLGRDHCVFERSEPELHADLLRLIVQGGALVEALLSPVTG